MIETFGCKYTEKVWDGEKTNKWSSEVVNASLRKLFMIHASDEIRDLIIPPSNRLHKLKGDMKGYWAIRVNAQWRIIFKWKGNNAFDVQIVDYH